MIEFVEVMWQVIHQRKTEIVEDWLKGYFNDFDMDMLLIGAKKDYQRVRKHE